MLAVAITMGLSVLAEQRVLLADVLEAPPRGDIYIRSGHNLVGSRRSKVGYRAGVVDSVLTKATIPILVSVLVILDCPDLR